MERAVYKRESIQLKYDNKGNSKEGKAKGIFKLNDDP